MNNKYNNLKKTKKKITGGMSGILIGVLSTLPIIVALTVWKITSNKETLEMTQREIQSISDGIIQKFTKLKQP